MSVDLDHIPFVQAATYRSGRGGYSIMGITLHDMEAPELAGTAESVARFFQHPPHPASAHYCVDADSIVQCVKDSDQAAHAPGVNQRHIGIEQAGYASQTPTQWKDPYSWAMLQLCAELVAKKCKDYGIPVVFLSVADLKAGRFAGITTHNNVSLAFRKSTHTDPGPSYPIEAFMAMVRNGVHTVDHPKAAGFKVGDTGKGVEFLQSMLNIVAKYRINSKGKSPGGQIKVDGSYGAKTKEAVAEFERFLNVMLKLQKKPAVKVDGIADSDVCGFISYWVKQALK